MGGVLQGSFRVVVADDHAAMRRSLCESLEAGGIEVAAEAATGAEAVTAALEQRPDLCLLDVRMPELSGIDATRLVKERLPRIKVVVISAEIDAETLFDAICAGADGYLSKLIDSRRLPIVLRAVAVGETAFPRRELQQALSRLRAAA